jgi:hypothetical protein
MAGNHRSVPTQRHHGAEDYGTITTYLRLQGLVPPSTALAAK